MIMSCVYTVPFIQITLQAECMLTVALNILPGVPRVHFSESCNPCICKCLSAYTACKERWIMSDSGAVIKAVDRQKGDLIYPDFPACPWCDSLMCSSDFTSLSGALWGGIALECGGVQFN